MSLIVNQVAVSTSGITVVTTPPIDTTGAKVIYLAGASVFGIGTPPGGYDNKGNTWTLLANPFSTCNGGMGVLRCLNPIVGSGHTFSVSGNSSFYTEMSVIAIAPLNYGTPYINTRADSNANPVKAGGGGITMPMDHAVFMAFAVAGCGWDSVSVDEGFTTVHTLAHLESAYYVQDIGRVNIDPTWTALSTGGIGGSKGGAVLESIGVFPNLGGDWQVYES